MRPKKGDFVIPRNWKEKVQIAMVIPNQFGGQVGAWTGEQRFSQFRIPDLKLKSAKRGVRIWEEK